MNLTETFETKQSIMNSHLIKQDRKSAYDSDSVSNEPLRKVRAFVGKWNHLSVGNLTNLIHTISTMQYFKKTLTDHNHDDEDDEVRIESLFDNCLLQ